MHTGLCLTPSAVLDTIAMPGRGQQFTIAEGESAPLMMIPRHALVIAGDMDARVDFTAGGQVAGELYIAASRLPVRVLVPYQGAATVTATLPPSGGIGDGEGPPPVRFGLRAWIEDLSALERGASEG